MLKFLIRKFFFDYLDNFYRITLLNLGFILSLSTGLGIYKLIQGLFFPEPEPFFILFMVCCILLTTSIYTGAASGVMNDIADQRRPGFKEWLSYLKKSILTSVLFSLFNSLVLFLCVYVLSFYINTKLAFGPFAAASILWLAVIWIIAAQYFYAVYWRLEKKFFRLIKKMVMIFLDNLLFSLTLFLGLLFLAVISIPTLLMIPGLLSLQLILNIGVKFQLYKYDYLEQTGKAAGKESPDMHKNKIPWHTILEKDLKRLDHRSVKSTFFPWKK